MAETELAILVVDDNESNRYTLVHRLRREGYNEIAEAESGPQALQALADRKFDLVLLDIMMPGMNGYEVLGRIKSDMSLRDIPVIMISAVDELDSVVRCIELGAEDYLLKPFNAVLLRARVGACLEKKRLRDQEASYLAQIESQKRRADDLLHAIFPPAAVQELKATNTVRPRRFEEVAVLFCDIVAFTDFCDKHPPEHVIEHLQTLIADFEELAAQHGLEKIKTIGDAFMATAGMFNEVEDATLVSVRCGLAMVEAARALETGWDVRVGIHFGPVVAGVVGKRQYIFDLWGDTVNVAARIVAEADPGAVVVSGPAWLRLRNRGRGSSKGFVPLKGKGKLELIHCHEVS